MTARTTKKKSSKRIPLHLKRADIISLVMKTNMSKAAATSLVSGIFELMGTALESGGSVDIHKFGTFKAMKRAPRSARNPKTGEAMSVPERTIVKFRPAAALKRQVDPNAAAATSAADVEESSEETSEE